MPGEIARRSAQRRVILSGFLREFTQVRARFSTRGGARLRTCTGNMEVQQLLLYEPISERLLVCSAERLFTP